MTAAHGGQKVPAATYRLQVHAGFGLDDAAEVAGYLADLGVTARLLVAAAALGRGQQPRLRHRRPRPHRRGARREGRLRPLRRGAARARPGAGARPGAQPHGRRRPGGLGVVVGRPAARAGQPARGGVRHRLGVRRRQGPPAGPGLGGRRHRAEGRVRRGGWGRIRRVALLREPLPDRARNRGRHAPGGTCAPALRAGRLAAGRRRPELPPVLRDQHPGRAARGGPGDLRRDARAGAAAGPRRRRRRASDRPSGRAGRSQGIPRTTRAAVG